MLNVSELKNVLEDFKSKMEDIKSTLRIIQECCSYSENVSLVPISNTVSLPVHAISLSKSTKNLDTLEKRVNSELKLIDDWLQNYKLSLNYSKTCYLLFSKHPHI